MFHRFDILNTLNSFLFHYVTQVVLHVLLSFSEDFVESHFINLVQKSVILPLFDTSGFGVALGYLF